MQIARKRNPSCIVEPEMTKVLRVMPILAWLPGYIQPEQPYRISATVNFQAISRRIPGQSSVCLTVEGCHSLAITLAKSMLKSEPNLVPISVPNSTQNSTFCGGKTCFWSKMCLQTPKYIMGGKREIWLNLAIF